MAAGKFNMQKASGGVASITSVDGVGNTSLAIPESGTLLSNDSGVVNIAGTRTRITGDFSNATHANMCLFQTNAINSLTSVGIIPNGTATDSKITIANSSDAGTYMYSYIYYLLQQNYKEK